LAYDEGLAERIRESVAGRDDLGPDEVVEKRMFGGLAFMIRGHMTVGINGDELMVRLGPDAYEEALGRPHAREMDFTGRALKGFVYVATGGTASDSDLADWIGLGVDFVKTLPPK